MPSFIRAGLPALFALGLAMPALAQTAPATPMAPAAAPATPGAAPATPGVAPATPGAAPTKQFEILRAGDKATQIELITGLCGIQMKEMSKEACHCLAEQTLTGLSDPQRDYLIATVVAPPVADRMLADGRVGQPDQGVIFDFISKTADSCATGKFVAKPDAAAKPAMPAAPAVPMTPATPAVPVKPAP